MVESFYSKIGGGRVFSSKLPHLVVLERPRALLNLPSLYLVIEDHYDDVLMKDAKNGLRFPRGGYDFRLSIFDNVRNILSSDVGLKPKNKIESYGPPLFYSFEHEREVKSFLVLAGLFKKVPSSLPKKWGFYGLEGLREASLDDFCNRTSSYLLKKYFLDVYS